MMLFYWLIGEAIDDPQKAKAISMFSNLGESIEFAGMAVAHLAKDPNKLSKTGKILLTGDLGFSVLKNDSWNPEPLFFFVQ